MSRKCRDFHKKRNLKYSVGLVLGSRYIWNIIPQSVVSFAAERGVKVLKFWLLFCWHVLFARRSWRVACRTSWRTFWRCTTRPRWDTADSSDRIITGVAVRKLIPSLLCRADIWFYNSHSPTRHWGCPVHIFTLLSPSSSQSCACFKNKESEHANLLCFVCLFFLLLTSWVTWPWRTTRSGVWRALWPTNS